MSKTLNIVSRNTITKDIYLGNIPMNVLDFGTVIKAKVISKDKSMSEVEFTRREPSPDVLMKYDLNYSEYDNICEKLRDQLRSYMF